MDWLDDHERGAPRRQVPVPESEARSCCEATNRGLKPSVVRSAVGALKGNGGVHSVETVKRHSLTGTARADLGAAVLGCHMSDTCDMPLSQEAAGALHCGRASTEPFALRPDARC